MDPRLLAAASTGNVSLLFELLQEDPQVLIHNVVLDSWDTPLHVASLVGQDGFVQMVLQISPELAKELNKQGMSALHLAITKRHLEVVRSFLAYDPSPCQLKTSYERTPLHLASLKGHLEVVRSFLDYDPSLCQLRDGDGMTPLHLASINGHLEVVRSFLSYDNSLCRSKTPDGTTPLHLAAIKGKLEILTELFQSCPKSITEPTNSGETVLFLAVNNNQDRVLETLINQITLLSLDENTIYNAKYEDGNNILHHACKLKRWEAIKLLVNNTYMDVNAINSKGSTALDIITSTTSELEIENLLRQVGARQALVDPNSIAVKIEKVIDSLKTGILIMASTFASVTFQAALNPPGGFWQDFAPGTNPRSHFPKPSNVEFSASNLVFIPVKFWGIELSYIPNVPTGNVHRPGKAVNRELDRIQFFAFLAYDAVCFMISILIIVIVSGTDVLPFSKSLAAGFLFVLMFSLMVFAGLLFRSGIAIATDIQVSQWVIYGALYNVVVGASIYLCIFFVLRLGWYFYKKRTTK